MHCRRVSTGLVLLLIVILAAGGPRRRSGRQADRDDLSRHLGRAAHLRQDGGGRSVRARLRPGPGPARRHLHRLSHRPGADVRGVRQRQGPPRAGLHHAGLPQRGAGQGVLEDRRPSTSKRCPRASRRASSGMSTSIPKRCRQFALKIEPWYVLTVGRAMILRWPLGTIMDDLKHGREKERAGEEPAHALQRMVRRSLAIGRESADPPLRSASHLGGVGRHVRGPRPRRRLAHERLLPGRIADLGNRA